HAFELRTGKPRWTKSAGEKVSLMCAGDGDGEALIATADRRWTIVKLDDGSMKPGGDHGAVRGRHHRDDGADCRALPSDESKSVADTTITDVFGHLPAVDGMNVRLMLRRDGSPPVV